MGIRLMEAHNTTTLFLPDRDVTFIVFRVKGQYGDLEAMPDFRRESVIVTT